MLEYVAAMFPPRVATAADEAALTALIAGAFADDPVMSWVFAGPGTRDKLGAFFGFLVHAAYLPLGATYTTGDAAVVWTPPNPPPWPPERGEAFHAAMSERWDDADRARLRIMNEATEAVHPAEPHWYLSVVAVDPRRRGTGLGSAILAATLEHVDSEGMPAYLESTNPRNVPLYERHGFVATREIELEGGPSLTAMWRAPTTA
jgi:GNAT superfamily N-acetyltransferase